MLTYTHVHQPSRTCYSYKHLWALVDYTDGSWDASQSTCTPLTTKIIFRWKCNSRVESKSRIWWANSITRNLTYAYSLVGTWFDGFLYIKVFLLIQISLLKGVLQNKTYNRMRPLHLFNSKFSKTPGPCPVAHQVYCQNNNPISLAT